MADAIVRLRVESQEYDQKLSRATQQLQHMEKEVRRTGDTFAYADKEELEFIKSLGSMETKATSAKGKINEMNSAFTEWSLLYKRLTDEEKASPLGAALSQSLDQLKGRIQSAKADLASVEQQLSGGMGGGINLGGNLDLSQFKELGGIFKDLGGKLGIPSDMLSKFPKLLSGASKGFSSMGGAAAGAGSSMLSALGPVGVAVGALALYVKGLTDAFKRNDDAIDQTMMILAPFKAMWQDIQRIFDEFASIFVDVNKNLGGLTTGFGDFITTVMPLNAMIKVWRVNVSTLGLALRALSAGIGYVGGVIKELTADTGLGPWLKDMKDEIKGALDYLNNLFSGIANSNIGKKVGLDKYYEDIKGVFTSQSELTKTNRELVALQDNIDKVRAANTRANADSRTKISDLRNKASDTETYDEKQRLAFLKQAMQEEEAMGQRQLELAQMQYELAQKKGTITHNSDADQQAIADAYAAMKDAETQLNERKRALQRPMGALNNKLESTEAKDAKDETEALKAQYEERAAAKIAALNKQSMSDQEYAKAVYEINHKSLQDIAALYDNGTKERAEANKKVLELETKYKNDEINAQLNLTKAQYNQEASEQIAALDRSAKTEEEYENAVYEIKRANLDRIVALYHEGTEGYAAACTAREDLERKHQDNLLRIEEKEKNKIKSKDNTTLNSLTSQAKEVGWNSSDMGLTGLKEKIELGVDITDEQWQEYVDKLNARRASLGMEPIQLNFETGNLEDIFDEVQVQFKNFTDKMNSGIGAISTVGNAFNDLKGIGDDLASAFSGEMDAWDALMSVFNSGIGIMQTVMSVMEAINTLQQLSGALSDQKKEKQLEETTTVVAGKMAEQQANIQEAGTSMTAAGADAAESSAKAGKSVAGIPIVGPILAVAAIAAVLAATFAAMSKAKSAGSFATGGMIPGSSFSGDNLTANVNSGELILNRAQQGSIAGQLQSNPMGNMRLSTEISGQNLRVVLNNDNRARGGSRTFYSELH